MQRGGDDALAREHPGKLDQAAATAVEAGNFVILGHQLAHQSVGEVFQVRASGAEEGVEDRVADLPLQQVRGGLPGTQRLLDLVQCGPGRSGAEDHIREPVHLVNTGGVMQAVMPAEEMPEVPPRCGVC
ncbi:hypothetical protein OG920_39995 [Streptomyces europaeiscabiei]|uniref:hypothetical protein n=1 Tax=Streptomyces europaeiscabiei TaxID=146819 RepID=UPI0030E0317B